MAVTNLYSNLPGHLVEFKDGGLQLTTKTTDTSSTKSLLILGTATDGPINEPVKIDAVTVSQVFGKEVNDEGYPNGATLTKYAKQAFKNGFDDVRCMRVTGSQAYTTIYGEQQIAEEQVTESIVPAEGSDDGHILGNPTFQYDFTNPPADDDGSTPAKIIVSKAYTDNAANTMTIDGVDVGLGTLSDKVEWIPYRGFKIKANTYPMVGDISVKCDGFVFAGDVNDDADGLVSHVVDSANAVEDTSDNTFSIEFNLSVALAGNVENFVANDHDVLDLLPVIGADYNAAGFKLSDGSGAIDPATYTGTLSADGSKYTVEFGATAPAGIADGDTFTLTYYPYSLSEVNRSFHTTFNTNVPESSLSLAALDGKKDATLKLITVTDNVTGTTTSFAVNDDPASDYNTKFEVQGNSLVVVDSTGLPVGGVIKATYTYMKPIVSDLELKIKSQWGGSLYKDGAVEVKKVVDSEDGKTYTQIIFTRPSAKIAKSYAYSSKYYPTVDDLILAMQNDTNNLNMFEIEIVKGEGTDTIDQLVTVGPKQLTEGGEDGIKPSANEMFVALSGSRYTIDDVGQPVSEYSDAVVTEDMIGYLKTQGAYQILENYNVDYIYPAGVYADSVQTVNPYSDFQRELALVCAVLTYRTKMTHGFIDVKPNSNTTLVGIDAYVAKLVNTHANLYYMTDQDGNVIYDADNKPMDIGWYTSVVVGPEVVMNSDVLGTYYGSPAIAYAALNAVLQPQSSPLNKAIRNVNGMKFKFSNKQMNALVGNRMVCFKLKNEGMATASSTPYVVDGITAGAPGCDYSDIAIVKVVTDVVDNIRQVADPFIGEQNTVEQRNALSALISKRLAKLVELGEIQSYEFEVSATIQQQLLGEASIALTIIPAMTLKKITTVVALRAAE